MSISTPGWAKDFQPDSRMVSDTVLTLVPLVGTTHQIAEFLPNVNIYKLIQLDGFELEYIDVIYIYIHVWYHDAGIVGSQPTAAQMMKHVNRYRTIWYDGTVDGKNPAPVDRYSSLSHYIFIELYTSPVMQDFFQQQYDKQKLPNTTLTILTLHESPDDNSGVIPREITSFPGTLE